LLKLQETCDRLKLPPNDVHGAGFFETREEVCIRSLSQFNKVSWADLNSRTFVI
jgi:hypothetical protein